MESIGQLIASFAQFFLTEALYIGGVAAALVGLVVVSLLVEACDTIPDGRIPKTRNSTSPTEGRSAGH
jgi:hypothetical protein